MTKKQLHAQWMRFRRECRLAKFGGRYRKAWRVPGTAENGRDAMFSAQFNQMQ